MADELFHDDLNERHQQVIASKSAFYQTHTFCSKDQDPSIFICSELFHNPELATKKAIGFKLFYYHNQETLLQKKLWDYLHQEKSIKVIHLYRKNLLESYVSRKIAQQTDVWEISIQHKKTLKDEKKLDIDINDFRLYMDKLLNQRTEALALFSSHATLSIEYQQLSEHYQQVMTQVQQFLNLEVKPLTKTLHKQSNLPIESRVNNYDEILKRLSVKKYYDYL